MNDPHITAFSGVTYDWHGKCNYSLAQNGTGFEPSYGVFAQFVDCSLYPFFNSFASCVGDVAVRDTPNSVFNFGFGELSQVQSCHSSFSM